MQCPSCGAAATGNFCAECGASLRQAACARCGATLVPDARFCTRCGTAVAGADGSGATRSERASRSSAGALPWAIAAGALVLLAIIIAVPLLRGGSADPTTDAPAMTGTPPPLTGTPREQADRLFNRIMTATERGDTAEALRFTPMAIQAYAMAAPLDGDGMYHLATVQLVARDYAGAAATAEQVLASEPNHLLALATAAEAARGTDDMSAARDYYARFLSAYDAEVARGLPEYVDHAPMLPRYRDNAQRIITP